MDEYSAQLVTACLDTSWTSFVVKREGKARTDVSNRERRRTKGVRPYEEFEKRIFGNDRFADFGT